MTDEENMTDEATTLNMTEENPKVFFPKRLFLVFSRTMLSLREPL